MHLPPANRRACSPLSAGDTVLAHPPTMRRIVHGAVLEVDGNIISIQTDTGLIIAVHIVDCAPTDLGNESHVCHEPKTGNRS